MSYFQNGCHISKKCDWKSRLWGRPYPCLKWSPLSRRYFHGEFLESKLCYLDSKINFSLFLFLSFQSTISQYCFVAPNHYLKLWRPNLWWHPASPCHGDAVHMRVGPILVAADNFWCMHRRHISYRCDSAWIFFYDFKFQITTATVLIFPCHMSCVEGKMTNII